MVTLATLTLDVEDLIYGLPQIERPVEDTLSTLVTDENDVEWRWSTEALHKRGDYWEEVTSDGSAGEIVLDTEDHPSGADTTVRRAQLRTTAAGGFSAGDVFRKNPKFPRVRIASMINEIIDSELAPYVWIRNTRSITWVDGTPTYALSANDYYVERMYQWDLGSTGDEKIHPLPQGWYDWWNNPHTDVQASGLTLVRVTKLFDTSATLYADVRTKPTSSTITALPTELANMVPYGAAAKLLLGQVIPAEMDPVRQQDPSRRSARSASYQDATGFLGEFLRMRSAYLDRLRVDVAALKRWVPTRLPRR